MQGDERRFHLQSEPGIDHPHDAHRDEAAAHLAPFEPSLRHLFLVDSSGIVCVRRRQVGDRYAAANRQLDTVRECIAVLVREERAIADRQFLLIGQEVLVRIRGHHDLMGVMDRDGLAAEGRAGQGDGRRGSGRHDALAEGLCLSRCADDTLFAVSSQNDPHA
jgi:hypothetical protein